MEIALDVGQADADHRVVQEGEKQHPAQGGQREGLGGGTEPALLDVETGRSSLGARTDRDLLGSTARAPLKEADPGEPCLGSHGWSFVYPHCG